MSSSIQKDRWLLYTLVLLATTFVLRLIIGHYTGLGIGEAYYSGAARHPELSYFDQPPLFIWLGHLSTNLFGINNLALRLPSIIFFTSALWILFLSTRYLYNERAGFYAVALINLSFVFTIPAAVWFQPDAPLMFFWMVTFYGLLHIFFPKNKSSQKEQRKNRAVYGWWIFTGFGLGFASLSKYHSLFIFISVLIFLLINKPLRHWIWHPGPYIAIVICALVSTPVVLWNINNNWASFIFQGSRANKHHFSLHFDWFFRSIIGQAIWLSPWVWWPLMKRFFVSFRQMKTDQVQSFLFWFSSIPIVFFTIITLWTDISFHFHWQAPGYMILFISLGSYFDTSYTGPGQLPKRLKNWIKWSFAILIVAASVLLLQQETGFWRKNGPKQLVMKFGGKNDPTIEGYDFFDVKTRFEKENWLSNENIFVASSRWWQAGKIDWVLKGQKPLIVFSNDPRNYAYFEDPRALIRKDAIALHFQGVDSNFISILSKFFDQVQQQPDLIINRGGRPESFYSVYYCKNFHIPNDSASLALPVSKRMLRGNPF